MFGPLPGGGPFSSEPLFVRPLFVRDPFRQILFVRPLFVRKLFVISLLACLCLVPWLPRACWRLVWARLPPSWRPSGACRAFFSSEKFRQINALHDWYIPYAPLELFLFNSRAVFLEGFRFWIQGEGLSDAATSFMRCALPVFGGVGPRV